MYYPRVVVPSGAQTASGNSGLLVVGGPVTQGEPNYLSLMVNTTAATGTTPSMTLTVQWSMDAGTSWADADGTADTFAAITATGAKIKQFQMKAPFYRISWAITGTTPSFTFSIYEWPQEF